MRDPLSSRWVQMVEQKFFCTILVAVGVGRAALSADRGQWLPGVPCCTTSSEPEAEGDRATTSLLRVLRAGADVALRSSIYPGSVPTGKVPINEIRKTPPFTQTTVPGKYQAVMPCFGVVFPESSRPPRPAQRITDHACVKALQDKEFLTLVLGLTWGRRRFIGVAIRLAALQQSHHHAQQSASDGHDRLLAANAAT